VRVWETHVWLRCRHCPRTITAADLAGRYGPAWLATMPTKRYDYDEVKRADSGCVSSRGEACGSLSTGWGGQEASCWHWATPRPAPVRVLSCGPPGFAGGVPLGGGAWSSPHAPWNGVCRVWSSASLYTRGPGRLPSWREIDAAPGRGYVAFQSGVTRAQRLAMVRIRLDAREPAETP
jgi:hypothetical protein